MGRFVAYERDRVDELLDRLKTRIPGAATVILKEMIWCANFEPGFFRGFPMDRGDICISVTGLRRRTGYGKKTIENAISVLFQENQIVKKGINEGVNNTLVYHIVNYELYLHNFEEGGIEKGSKGEARGKQGGTSYEVQEVQDLKDRVKDIAPDGAGQASATPPPPAQKRVRKASSPKSPADPLTNPTAFLKRVEAEYPNTVLAWERDTGIMKALLSGRKTAKVEDPQTEVWGLWEKFSDGTVDGVFTMKDRGHDIPAFRRHYQLLLEKAGTNGKTQEPPPPPPKTVHHSGAGAYDQTCPNCGQQTWKCNLDGCPARKEKA